jgi:hypothetical protein
LGRLPLEVLDIMEALVLEVAAQLKTFTVCLITDPKGTIQILCGSLADSFMAMFGWVISKIEKHNDASNEVAPGKMSAPMAHRRP